MLLRFSFENFRSFRGKTTLTMVAGTQRTLNDVLIRRGKYRLLPTAVIYGANASGKSSVIQALSTLCNIVESGSLKPNENLLMSSMELLPFAHDSNTDPISFELEFFVDGLQFIYFLAFSVETLSHIKNRHICEERLEMIQQKKAINIFTRTKSNILVGTDKEALDILRYSDVTQLKKLTDSVVENMDGQTLFLTGGFKSTIRKTVADKIIEFVTRRIQPLTDIDKTLLSTCAFLRYDTETSKSAPMIREDLFDGIIKAADFGPQQIGWRLNENGKQDTAKYEMISKYQDAILPSALMESAGTVKLLQLSLMLENMFSTGGLLIVDEMDNAIHPEIMKAIIALYGNPDINKNGAQLIFTTHNPIYMDKDLLRRDQILIIEKNPDTYISSLYSLADFGSVSVRNDQDFMRNYFKGRYGRLPYLDLEAILANSMESRV